MTSPFPSQSLHAPRVYPGSRFSARPLAGLLRPLSPGALSVAVRPFTQEDAPRLWDPNLLDRLTPPLSRIRE